MDELNSESSNMEGVTLSDNCDNIGEFFFESDHLALKGNPDYHNTLKVIALLEAQRSQAIQDLDALHKSHQEALSDPLAFVQKLQRKEPMNFPVPQNVATLPTINWNKYALTTSGHLPTLANTRSLKPGTQIKEEDEGKVRGRNATPSKPATFNQLWTSQEQKRLEELLVLYPPEEVESRRWEKISKALGNRTPPQVASRVQKYFIQLSKAGLAVPGRAPRRTAVLQSGKASSHRLTMMRMTSSFFRHHMPSVYMSDSQDMDEFSCPSTSAYLDPDLPKMPEGNSVEEDEEEMEEGLSQGGMWEDPRYQELLYLQKLKEEKKNSQPLFQHIGFTCDRCKCDPIVGTRWHCTECPQGSSIDFCSDCVDCQEELGEHKASHHMESMNHPTKIVRPFLDGDYLHLMGNGQYCNYLDPNYMPAAPPGASPVKIKL